MDDQLIGVEVHPAADLFPRMSAGEFEELKADIGTNGQRVPITYWGGMLLDGRHRYRACQELGIDPEEEELDEDLVPDPVAWVLSTNLHRRHLSETQREVVAAKVATLGHGGDRKSTDIKGQICPSTDQAAEQLNVKPRSVKNAKAAIKGGCKELIEAMERSEITSSLASKFVKAVPDKRKQKAILKEGVNAVRQAVKDWEQEEKERSGPSVPPSIVVPTDDEYEDCDDDEPNRIGQVIDQLKADFAPHELTVIGEALIAFASQRGDR